MDSAHELEFTITGHVDRPVAQVYEAVAEPAQLSRFYATKGARGAMTTGATVWWEFDDYPGEFPVEVVEAAPPHRVVLTWQGDDTADGIITTTVTITFDAQSDQRTRVTIHEAGWPDTDDGRRAAFGNCEGWAGFLWAMRAYLEHEIDLRTGFYV